MRVAHVSTFPEMRCGIAFYASDLIQSLSHVENRKYALHYGKNFTSNVAAEANVATASELRELARLISRSDCNVVSLQHEFGIWGGAHGENIIPFLEEITLPIVSTLHTTFTQGSQPPIRRELLSFLVRRSAITIVLTAQSRQTLCTLLDMPENVVHVIPHGTPDLPFKPVIEVDSSQSKPNWRLLSFGFFRPDKGLEVILQAMRKLKDAGTRFHYKIAGSPQPQFPEQDDYFRKIKNLIFTLGLDDCVTLDNRFLSRDEQVAQIQNSHIAIFAYQDPMHASSGTVALALAAGRPVICTPFEFAKAMKNEIKGVFVSQNFGADGLSKLLGDILENKRNKDELAKDIYEQTRHWTWPKVAEAYIGLLNTARSSRIANLPGEN